MLTKFGSSNFKFYIVNDSYVFQFFAVHFRHVSSLNVRIHVENLILMFVAKVQIVRWKTTSPSAHVQEV